MSRLDNMAALMNLPELLGFRSELQVSNIVDSVATFVSSSSSLMTPRSLSR